MTDKYEVIHRSSLWPWIDEDDGSLRHDLEVVTLFYPGPSECVRVEIWSSTGDVDGDVQNMTTEQAEALGQALVTAAAVAVPSVIEKED